MLHSITLLSNTVPALTLQHLAGCSESMAAHAPNPSILARELAEARSARAHLQVRCLAPGSLTDALQMYSQTPSQMHSQMHLQTHSGATRHSQMHSSMQQTHRYTRLTGAPVLRDVGLRAQECVSCACSARLLCSLAMVYRCPLSRHHVFVSCAGFLSRIPLSPVPPLHIPLARAGLHQDVWRGPSTSAPATASRRGQCAGVALLLAHAAPPAPTGPCNVSGTGAQQQAVASAGVRVHLLVQEGLPSRILLLLPDVIFLI